VKKGTGTSPNSKPKKGRDAYLVAKKNLEAKRAGTLEEDESADVPRPSEDVAVIMEKVCRRVCGGVWVWVWVWVWMWVGG